VSLLEVTGVRVLFGTGRGFVSGDTTIVRAVDEVSMTIEAGRVVAVVGESGSGKTTLARAIAGLIEPTAGSMRFRGEPLRPIKFRPRNLRSQVQMVFQDPFESLNPRKTIFDALNQPLRNYGIVPAGDRKAEAIRLLELVGLVPGDAFLGRRARQLSGGQRQRVGIARALATRPSLIIADEAVSSLDVSIRAQILALFVALKADLGLAYLFISHDLAVVRSLADDVLVMYLGEIVEQGSTDAVFDDAVHPYTHALLAASPSPEPGAWARVSIVLTGDPPSPADVPTGCRFHPRCWLRERLGNPAICETEKPILAEIDGADGHRASCHFAHEARSAAASPFVDPLERSAVPSAGHVAYRGSLSAGSASQSGSAIADG
jgi:oligopeptide/dipeptide ABC transporter ATP-binding protein